MAQEERAWRSKESELIIEMIFIPESRIEKKIEKECAIETNYLNQHV